MIAVIVAQARNRVIGKQNDLPWYLPADLKHFKDLTSGHTVIMGRKTFDSIMSRNGKPLPNRRNIVVSGHLTTVPEGFELADSLEKALEMANHEAFIIGGATLYEEALQKHLADTIYVTEVATDIDGDTYFPVIPAAEWHETSRQSHAADDKNQYAYTFVTLEHA